MLEFSSTVLPALSPYLIKPHHCTIYVDAAYCLQTQ